MRLGFFAYPWDLADEGPEEAVAAMAARCGCNALAVNAVYHHARLLRPRRPGSKIVELPGAVAAFQPQTALYPPGGPVPLVHTPLVRASVLARIRDACAHHGVDLGLWIVGLHNSSLGEQFPGLCTVNCFGDRYTYNLCPTAGAAGDYVTALARDLCAQFRPQRLILEAAGYLGLRHGVHHELFFSTWDEALELLLSLCFCPACRARARAADLDAETLRGQVALWAGRLLNGEPGTAPFDPADGRLSCLLAQIPDLAAYQALRTGAVTDLVRRVQAVAAATGAELDVIPASFHRPVSRAWLEGAHLPDLAAACNHLLIPAYWPDAGQVAGDLGWAHWLAPAAYLAAGLNACEPALAGARALAAQAAACRRTGCRGIYYYNYGLLPEARLEWVARANAEVC